MSYYPPLGFHFRVEFLDTSGAQKFSETSFQEVSGLTVEIGTEELSEGGVNDHSHRLPGKVKYGNLVLKRGMFTDSKLVDWIVKAVENYSFDPLNITVSLLNADHQPLMSWHFFRAWPVKWVTSDFKAQDNGIVVESFELAYKNFTCRKPNS
ncbi:MAG TPA: phage tail protein [Bacteroidia bacterium]|nr:phage tail protein [Bacteroidia bacterium]